MSYENGNIINDEITIGTAVKDIIKEQKGRSTCFMFKQEWLGILNAIKDDQTLCVLKIHNLVKANSGFRAATLVGQMRT